MLSRDKKGLSIMIGYVLLIAIAIIMSLVVYQFIKTYVPRDTPKCPDEVSIFLKEVTYDCDTDKLEISIKNNGLFNIAGYFIHATTDEEQELATEDLSEYVQSGGEKYSDSVVFVLGDENAFVPNKEKKTTFDLTDFGTIYKIELIPVRWQEQEGKLRFTSCGNSKVEKVLSCYVEAEPEEPQCSDGIDNDGDGCIDYSGGDEDCTNDLDTTESGSVCSSCTITETTETTCNDEIDNDCDGNVDCLDSDCDDDSACQTLTECSDGIDNDGDGMIDFGQDTGCSSASDDIEANCGDGTCNGGETLSTCYEDCNTCDGTWNAGSENVECDGTPIPDNCVDCICTYPYISDGVGGCIAPGGYGCEDYCIDLQIGYTDGFCTANLGQCQSQGGELVPGGDEWCSGLLCCCQPKL